MTSLSSTPLSFNLKEWRKEIVVAPNSIVLSRELFGLSLVGVPSVKSLASPLVDYDAGKPSLAVVPMVADSHCIIAPVYVICDVSKGTTVYPKRAF